MFLPSLLALTALVTSTLSSPTPSSTPSPSPQQNEQFALDIRVLASPDLVLDYYAHVAFNGSDEVFLVGELSFAGSLPATTPAFFTGNSTDAVLNFAVSSEAPNPRLKGVYGAIVPEVGNNGAYAEAVVGIRGAEDEEWGYDDQGEITHQLQAALNQFYLCDDTINGEEASVLKFGTPYFNGTALLSPVGCSPARLFQHFDD